MKKMYFPQYARGRQKGVVLKKGKTILDHIREIGGIEIDTDPGEDVVRISQGSGMLGPLSDYEDKMLADGRLKPDQRLASQAKVISDSEGVIVFISSYGKYTILTDTIKRDTKLEPVVVREGDRIKYNGQDIAPYNGHIYGLAVDIGTTTVVMQVVDLETGENIYKPIAIKNPQIVYGNDIISRIGHTIQDPDGLSQLQGLVVSAINESLEKLEDEAGLGKGSVSSYIYNMVVVGNSTMREIFFGQEVRTLGLIPFEAINRDSITMDSKELGLNINSRARVYGPPLIGGHAGADCLADIIASSIYKKDDISMIIDIGTNGEVVIGNNKKMLTASCAAGGAYEGYQISCGVGAVQGAITKVEIADGKVKYQTLDDRSPVGICGSGVIDLLAQLYKNGIMNERTRIKDDFYLDGSIYITQNDINQLVIAKAGLRTDQDLLIKYFGATLDDVKHIYLAGAFGNFMDIENAMAIGLLPRTDISKFIRFGNGALAGAMDMLLSKKLKSDAEYLKDFIEHKKPNEIEGQQFQYMVAENMYIRG